MAQDTENAFFTRSGGQELPTDMAISTGKTPAGTGMAATRRFQGKKDWHETCSSIVVSDGFNQHKAGGNKR
jgi:hypothetical protein